MATVPLTLVHAFSVRPVPLLLPARLLRPLPRSHHRRGNGLASKTITELKLNPSIWYA
jgi:hypothetical protein